MLGDTDLIDADIATCIYVGIMTDTGSFRFRSTTNKTHEIIAKLLKKVLTTLKFIIIFTTQTAMNVCNYWVVP